MRILTTCLVLTLALVCPYLWAQVEEMSNTEMTEAYIQDGSIVIKQRIQQKAEQEKHKVKVTVGPGQPAVSEAEQVLELEQQNTRQHQPFDREFSDNAPQQQFTLFENNQATSSFITPNFQSNAAQAQQVRAQNLVRNGLGLPSDTQITQELMVQYLTGFSGQSSGLALGVTQGITNDGYYFSLPNPGGQLPNGVFPSGDNSMNVNINSQQVIWNLLFPKE